MVVVRGSAVAAVAAVAAVDVIVLEIVAVAVAGQLEGQQFEVVAFPVLRL
jgi:hypothetical protein